MTQSFENLNVNHVRIAKAFLYGDASSIKTPEEIAKELGIKTNMAASLQFLLAGAKTDVNDLEIEDHNEVISRFVLRLESMLENAYYNGGVDEAKMLYDTPEAA